MAAVYSVSNTILRNPLPIVREDHVPPACGPRPRWIRTTVPGGTRWWAASPMATPSSTWRGPACAGARTLWDECAARIGTCDPARGHHRLGLCDARPLEAKSLVTSSRSAADSDAPSRRLFIVTAAGAHCLVFTRTTRDRLWSGVDLRMLLEAWGAGAQGRRQGPQSRRRESSEQNRANRQHRHRGRQPRCPDV